jgi:hypothetical protein
MRIGTIAALEMVSDIFDSFCIQRDYNRRLDHLRMIRDWATKKQKKLCILANSGCLSFCGGQTFHDNLVAHEGEGCNGDITDALLCRRYLRIPTNHPAILKATWIRPEDINHYDNYFDMAKLATRSHQNPHKVITAYGQRRYRGNLLDLLEPGYSDVLGELWLDNGAFPDDWFERTGHCLGQCHNCDYCDKLFKKVVISR